MRSKALTSALGRVYAQWWFEPMRATASLKRERGVLACARRGRGFLGIPEYSFLGIARPVPGVE